MRQVRIFESGGGLPISALQDALNAELDEEGRVFDGIEFHVLDDRLVAVLMFKATEEE